MKRWTLSLVLLAAALCGQPNARADDDRDYWRYRHDGWRHRHHYWRDRDYDEDRRDYYRGDRPYWREHHYEDWQDRREYWRHRHHRRQFIQAGPVIIER